MTAVAFSPDGTQIATASHDGTARLWQTAAGTEHTTLTGHTSWVTAVAFSPDGTLIATASHDGTARLWQTATGRQVVTLLALGGAGTAVLLPDGSYKLAGDVGEGPWWAVKLCRFEPGELDPHLPQLRRLPAKARILPPPG